MKLSYEHHGAITVLTTSGELTSDEADAFRRTCRAFSITMNATTAEAIPAVWVVRKSRPWQGSSVWLMRLMQ